VIERESYVSQRDSERVKERETLSLEEREREREREISERELGFRV